MGEIKTIGVLALAALGLTGCSADKLQQAAQSKPGQLFCAIQMAGGGEVVRAVIDAEATAVAPAAAPVAVLVTGQSKAFVDQTCRAAAVSAGGVAGGPVSPPANPAATPAVAVQMPAAPEKGAPSGGAKQTG